MIDLIRNIFLGNVFIFVVLIAILLILTRWSLLRRREYVGYALGWLLAVFFVIIYSSLGGQAEPTATTESVDLSALGLNFFQVIIPALIGLALGGGIMVFLRRRGDSASRQSLMVALLTALNLIVLFFMIISGEQTRRMIGIFALAFGIGALLAIVLYRPAPGTGGPVVAQAAAYEAADFEDGKSRLDRIRERMKRGGM